MNNNQETNVLNNAELIGKHIGQRCKQRREELGLTVEDISSSLDDNDFYSDTKAYIEFENNGLGVLVFGISLINLCNILQLNISELFTLDKPKEELKVPTSQNSQVNLTGILKMQQFHLDKFIDLNDVLKRVKPEWLNIEFVVEMDGDGYVLDYYISEPVCPSNIDEYRELLNELLDVVDMGSDQAESNILFDLTEELGELISSYNDENFPMEDALPSQVLEHCIDQQRLTIIQFADKFLDGDDLLLNYLITTDRSFPESIAKQLAKQLGCNESIFYLETTSDKEPSKMGNLYKESISDKGNLNLDFSDGLTCTSDANDIKRSLENGKSVPTEESTNTLEHYSFDKVKNQELTPEFLKELDYHWSFIEPWITSKDFYGDQSIEEIDYNLKADLVDAINSTSPTESLDRLSTLIAVL